MPFELFWYKHVKENMNTVCHQLQVFVREFHFIISVLLCLEMQIAPQIYKHFTAEF